MTTYKLRFKFHLSHKGMLTGDCKEFDFILSNGHQAKIHCVDAEKFEESTKFVIISGGYLTEEDAREYGNELKEVVLCFGAKYRVGLDVGKDKVGSQFSTSIKNKTFEEQGVQMIDDVHGVTTYSEERPAACMSFSALGLISPRDAGFFTREVCKIISLPRKVDKKTQLSMELLTASFFETSPRSRFLTLVLSAESILNPEDRSENAKALVDELRRLTKSIDLDKRERCSILGSLNWLDKDSISQSLRKMASTYLPEKNYDGMSSEKFIKKCYDARSNLVHTGGVDEKKFNVDMLAANLEVYMADMLVAKSCI